MKRIPQTAEIVERIRAAFGADANPSDYAVYEAIALNQNPIRQKHPLFEGAIAQDSLLRGLVANIEAESAPLQVMHDRSRLPAGRIFTARMNGSEARVLFAIPVEKTELIADLDKGIIDQVSVNVLAKSLECSACGWDYLGEDASYMNVMNGECGNEHQLRKDGVHIKLQGLDVLSEISLVGSGGADGARIVDKNSSIFASESFQRLAASGFAPAMLVASFSIEGKHEMDLATLVANLTDEKVKVTNLTTANATLTADLETANTALAAANTTVAERDATIVALTAERDAALAAVKPDAPTEATLTFIKDLCSRTLIANGDQTPEIPESVEDQIKAITEGQAKLSAIIPAGPRGHTTPSDLDKSAPAGGASSAFRRA